MAEVNAKITVSKVDGNVRVVVVLPSILDALSLRDQGRVVETAMWRAAEMVGAFTEHERVTGSVAPLTAEARAA